MGAPAEWIQLDRLVPWAENPRRRSDDDIAELARELVELGFGAPIVARRQNLEIIAGHGLRLALLKIYAEQPEYCIEGAPRAGLVPVRLLDVDEQTAHRLARADNRMGERSDWDVDRLLEQLERDQRAGFDVAIEGWSDTELVELLARIKPPADAEDPEQPRLDISVTITCPKCGHEFKRP